MSISEENNQRLSGLLRDTIVPAIYEDFEPDDSPLGIMKALAERLQKAVGPGFPDRCRLKDVGDEEES